MSLFGSMENSGYDGWGWGGDWWWWIILIFFVFFGYWGRDRGPEIKPWGRL